MLTIALIIIILAAFLYGVYVLFKGEIKVKDGNKLKGKNARLIGLLIALSPIFSFVLAIIMYIFLISFGIDIAEDDPGSRLASILAVVIPFLLILAMVKKLSNYLYTKQESNAKEAT